jgi:hypothetical protein
MPQMLSANQFTVTRAEPSRPQNDSSASYRVVQQGQILPEASPAVQGTSEVTVVADAGASSSASKGQNRVPISKDRLQDRQTTPG